MNEPTVVFVAASGGHGGPVKSMLDILPYQLGRSVVIGPWTTDAAKLMADTADEVVTAPRPLGRDRAVFVWKLARLLRRKKPDTVMANGLSQVAFVSLAARIAGYRGPVAVWVHNYEMPGVAKALRVPIRSLGSRLRWHAVSNLAATVASDGGLTDHSTVVLVPNPISEQVVPASRLASNRVRVGYLGSDRSYKGFDLLPDIVQLTKSDVEFQLYTLRAKSPAWKALDAIAHAGDTRVVNPGRAEPVSEAYAACDIVLIPSRSESFCRVAAEAMRNRLPVIATDLEPLRALVSDDAGVLFAEEDVSAAAAAIDELANDIGLRSSMGKAGYERSLQFDTDAIGGVWRDILRA